MKKFLLVVFIGMVLAMNLYGIVNKIITEYINKIDYIEETTITVYVE